MNTRLEILFEKYKLSEKNKHEISQIYSILPDIKKQNLLNNFELFVLKVQKIEKSIEIEKDILIGDAVERIRNTILENRKNKIDVKIKQEINLLKGEL